MDFYLYESKPAPVENNETKKQCALPKNDNETLKRQACMFSASGEMICDEKRRDGQGMIVRETCSRPPMAYTQ